MKRIRDGLVISARLEARGRNGLDAFWSCGDGSLWWPEKMPTGPKRGGFMCEMSGEGGNSFQCFNISPQAWGRG